MTTECTFQVGDRVHHRKYGVGLVYRINTDEIMSVCVRFPNGDLDFFTREGSGIYGDSPRIVHATADQVIPQLEREIDRAKTKALQLEKELITWKRKGMRVVK